MRLLWFLCIPLFFSVYGSEELLLFDFESGLSPVRQVWNREQTSVEISGQWFTEGRKSLSISAPAFDRKKMHIDYYPGVEFNLSVRDWRPYRYLQFDLKLEEDDLPFSILIQYGRRWERISLSYQFPRGAYRVKLNLPELIGEPVADRLSHIRALEFHVTRPEKEFTIFVDNIRLIKGNPGEPVIYDSVLSLADPNHPRPPFTRQIISSDAGRKELLAILDSEFPGREFGLKAASISEAVPFRNLKFRKHWKNSLELPMAKNETRSVQVIFFRRPTEQKETFAVSCSIPGLKAAVERIGYLRLPSFYSLERHGFVPGWYPDPILAMNRSAALEAEQWTQPLVLSIATGAETPEGVYHGTLTVRYRGQRVDLPLTITVFPVAMPKHASLPILLGVGSCNGEIDHEFWLKYRMNPHYSGAGNIYDRRKNAPLDIAQLSELVNKGMTLFNMMYINPADCTRMGRDAYLNGIFRKYSETYMKKLAAAGLAERAVIYGYDEVTVSGAGHKQEYEMVRDIFGALKERYSKYGVRTAATLRDCSDPAIHSLPVDIWISLGGAMNAEALEHLRSLGKEAWWYHIWWEIWYPPAWSRSIPWSTLGKKYQGWLYYNVNGPWSKKQSLGESALTSWGGFSVPNLMKYGTGSLVYCDKRGRMRPSLRLINFREGMYDYDLATGLKQRITEWNKRKEKLTKQEKKILTDAEELFTGGFWNEIGELTDKPVEKNKEDAALMLERKRVAMLRAATALQKLGRDRNSETPGSFPHAGDLPFQNRK